MELDRIKQIYDDRAKKIDADQKHAVILNALKVNSDTVLSAVTSLIKYLEGHITKTQVVNQLENIGTPDALEVIPYIEALNATIKNQEKVDLSEVTSVMKSILDEAKLIPKNNIELPESPEPIDYSDQFKSLADAVKAVEEVIKNQKLIAEAPIVNVDAPVINVDKPDLKPLQNSIKSVVEAVRAIVIPVVDMSSVEKLIEKSNKLLKELLEKPVGSGGGGGGRATPYQDSSGIPAFVELVNGRVPIDIDMSTEGIATETKQDSQITQLANILIELTQKTEATQNQQVELINAIRLVLQLIANPAYVDKSANQMRSQVTGSLTAVTTVTTVTNLTNIGSFPADHLQRMDNMTAWATNVRQIIV